MGRSHEPKLHANYSVSSLRIYFEGTSIIRCSVSNEALSKKLKMKGQQQCQGINRGVPSAFIAL